MVPVQSSNITAIGYDDETNVLRVEFHGGRTYDYFSVPRNIWEGLIAAPSHGKYLNRNVKSAGYRYVEK